MRNFPVYKIDGHICRQYIIEGEYPKDDMNCFEIDGIRYGRRQATTYDDVLANRDGYHYYCLDENRTGDSLLDLEVYYIHEKYCRRYNAE